MDLTLPHDGGDPARHNRQTSQERTPFQSKGKGTEK
jgi:hypothetical protein